MLRLPRWTISSPAAPTVGALGVNIRSLGDWLENDEDAHPDRTGEIVRPNPLTGDAGKTQGGKESYIAQSCIFSPRMGMGAIGSIRRRFIRL